ncbi:S1 RNA-binding domain-containing protein [Fructobacillus durionis]|uniref:S1 motif domain-containing protein n=1 Tax=Fructobacillus durionis TaxID=283737 RepID=A0A1I1EM69_9LACO|nr:S1-like domain-containing RNA-binding protein [Fructobacillus durionis]SFB88279.1 hypothetical protein SAMN05660453_0546 [Fructobacillus durionis]
MNEQLGQIIKAKVTDENGEYFYAQTDGGHTYEIDKDELMKPLKIGGYVTGFAYQNEDHRLQITKAVPDVQKDQYSWGKVVQARSDLGIFVDIGLANKDLAVSLDDLPTMKELWPKKGDRLLLSIKEDNKGRLWGKPAQQDIIQAVSRQARLGAGIKKGDKIKATVYRNKLVGTLVITDNYCLGFIHPSEREVEPRLGEVIEGRVLGVNDRGVINLSLKPLAYKVMDEDAQFLLLQLQRKSEHFLPFNDKSAPEDIRAQFGFSKGQFKRALGRLYKDRLIEMVDDGIRLTDKGLGN